MSEPIPRNRKGNPAWVKGVSANPATTWKPGQSGNPNGRPVWREFRAKCRRHAERLLERMVEAEPAEAARLVAVFAEVADRGGYLSVATSARLILDALATKELSEEQRTDLVRALSEGESEDEAIPALSPSEQPK